MKLKVFTRWTFILTWSVTHVWWAATAFAGDGAVPISAKDPQGTDFQNPSRCPLSFKFAGSGLWSYNPFTYGWHSAEGISTATCSHRCFYPAANPGALVARRASGETFLVGTGTTVELEPFERVRFVINDDVETLPGIGYDDNDGALLLSWRYDDPEDWCDD